MPYPSHGPSAQSRQPVCPRPGASQVLRKNRRHGPHACLHRDHPASPHPRDNHMHRAACNPASFCISGQFSSPPDASVRWAPAPAGSPESPHPRQISGCRLTPSPTTMSGPSVLALASTKMPATCDEGARPPYRDASPISLGRQCPRAQPDQARAGVSIAHRAHRRQRRELLHANARTQHAGR